MICGGGDAPPTQVCSEVHFFQGQRRRPNEKRMCWNDHVLGSEFHVLRRLSIADLRGSERSAAAVDVDEDSFVVFIG